MRKRIQKYFLPITVLLLLLASCGDRQLQEAHVEFVDPYRHYYPVLQGEVLAITYEIDNVSENTLFIQEVQTTCGCIVPLDALPIVIFPKRNAYLHLAYNTIKNTGSVEHYIWCYGNFADSAYRELRFDTNIVPSADYIRDYEQLFREHPELPFTPKDLVNGKLTDRGYYTGELYEDPRAEEQRENQEMMDNFLF